jgi:hypothetical protein
VFAALFWWEFEGKQREFFEQLRRYIGDESWPRYVGRAGLRQKIWFSNEETGSWGALAVWETEDQMEEDIRAALASARVRELTGVRLQKSRDFRSRHSRKVAIQG